MVNSYSTVQGVPQVDPIAVRQLMESDHNPMGGVTFSKFDSALGTAADWIGAAGPGIDAAFGGGHVVAKTLLSGTISALYGQGGGATAPGMGGGLGIGGGMGSTGAYGPTPMVGKFLSMPGAPPGYPGGGGGGGMPGAPPGFPGGGGPAGGGFNAPGATDVGQFDSQINSMMSNNMMFLALQTKVQNVSQTVQMLSNIAKTDHETKLAAARNIRSG